MRPRRPAPSGPADDRALLDAWLNEGPVPPPLDRFLSFHVRPQKQADPTERKRLTEQMLAVQRHGYLALFCQWLLLEARRRDAFLEAPDQTTLDAFARQAPTPLDLFGVMRTTDRDVFRAWVGHLAGGRERAYIERYGPAIRAALGALGTPEAALLAHGVPLWFAGEWRRRAALGGFDPTAFLALQNRAAPLWIRPRPGAEAATALADDGFTVTAEAGGLRVEGSRSLFTTAGHRDGLFEIQDLGSQAAGALATVRPGDFVWDACAGAGGKTLQLAAGLREKGVVYASDVRPDKLDALRRRARRAGTSIVRTLPFDGMQRPEFPHEVRKRGGFDHVVVDAPCSSSGTWRRNPDARLRNSPAELGETCELQRRILETAAGAVRPGGRLVYLTCSWMALEDEDIADDFSERHPDFQRETQGFHGAPVLDADTFFGAVWTRRRPG